MKLNAFQVHRFWLIRAGLALLITVLADGIIPSFVAKPIPWVVLISESLPLTMYFFVAVPVLKQAERESH